MGLISRILTLFRSRASSALDKAEDPRQIFDYAYAQQQELLSKTRRGLVDVATSRVRLEQQAQRLVRQVPHAGEQASRALAMGREDLARMALERKQGLLIEIEELERQVVEVAADERRLTQTEQQLAARIEQFRTRRDAMSARYTAARAQVRVSEAVAGLSGEMAELGMMMGRAMEKTERLEARAAAMGALLEGGNLALPEHGTDSVERELRKGLTAQAVDDELAALKARLAPGREPPALPSGP